MTNIQRLIDFLKFDPVRGGLYNPRTRKWLKLPMNCELRSVWQKLWKDPAGGPRRKYAQAEFKYRGRLYRADFKAGRKDVLRLAMSGARRVELYRSVVSSQRFAFATAYVLRATGRG